MRIRLKWGFYQYFDPRIRDTRMKYTPDKDDGIGVCSWLCILAHFDEVEDVELERDTKLSLSAIMSKASKTRTTFNIVCPGGGAICGFAGGEPSKDM